MADNKEAAASQPIESAADLRKRALELQLREMERQNKIKTSEAQKHAEFVEDFFSKHIGDNERAIIKRVVMAAAADGKLEAMVYSFPSSFCTDSGRAINNGLKGWQDTLQGRAKEVYELFDIVARPRGYTLKALVINFPDGMPGDIGFFLGWEPPVE